jgi:hypothetical protein
MIYYEVTRADILKASTFQWSRVLQMNHNTDNRLTIEAQFYTFLKDLKPKVQYNQITIEEANYEIRKKVVELQDKYPKDFPKVTELGWYSKIILANEFLAGNVTIRNEYSLDTMLSVRERLVNAAEQDMVRAEKQAEIDRIAYLDKLKEREASRIPVTVGMLFHTKEGIARAYQHQYPSNTKSYIIIKELSNTAQITYGKYTVGRKCWRIDRVLIEGGRAYLDDLITIG